MGFYLLALCRWVALADHGPEVQRSKYLLLSVNVGDKHWGIHFVKGIRYFRAPFSGPGHAPPPCLSPAAAPLDANGLLHGGMVPGSPQALAASPVHRVSHPLPVANFLLPTSEQRRIESPPLLVDSGDDFALTDSAMSYVSARHCQLA
jgi:hypothetical protein